MSALNPEQALAFDRLRAGENLFLTGPGGTGKTFVVWEWLQSLRRQSEGAVAADWGIFKRQRRVACTASTGIAALHLSGSTIHSWSGCGIADKTADQISRSGWWLQRVQPRIESADALLIDECFDYKQPILTEEGWQYIGAFVNERRQIRVASRDPETGRIEFKRVLRWLRNPAPQGLLRINAGRSDSRRGARVITCTPEHKIKTPGGYVRAGDLGVGSEVVVRAPGLTPTQRSILVGSLLGDASCHRSEKRTSSQVCFSHGIEQRDYLLFKREAFGSLSGQVVEVPSGFEGGKPVLRFYLGVTDETCKIRDHMVDDGVHASGRRRWRPTPWLLGQVDELALAVWFLDNGSVSKASTTCTLHTERFSEEVNRSLADFLSTRFGVEAVLQESRGLWFLRFNAAACRRLLEIVRQFTPACMAWKVGGGEFLAEAADPLDTCVATVRSIAGARPTHPFVYDIEVEDHHNYVAGNVVVSNCSMLDAVTLDLVDELCQIARHNYTPFGGMQVVFVGDFGQLPPVQADECGFAFESQAWKSAGVQTVNLDRAMRQNDQEFVQLLLRMRMGELTQDDERKIVKRRGAFDEKRMLQTTRVVTTNDQAAQINKAMIMALPGPLVFYDAVDVELDQKAMADLDKHCLSPKRLPLKPGARVMFTKNDSLERRWANGTCGTVLATESSGPIVRLDNGREIAIQVMTWEKKDGDDQVLASRTQFPLRLAWASTAHKVQGMTLESASIDLSRTFSPGQAYVALSRVRNLESLNLEGWCGREKVTMHPTVKAFLRGEPIAPRTFAGKESR